MRPVFRLAVEGGDPASVRIAFLLLGAIATLIAGAVLQVWVVPRVQAGTRRLERWEAVGRRTPRLDDLLREQLRREVARFRSAVEAERHLGEMSKAEDLAPERHFRMHWPASRCACRLACSRVTSPRASAIQRTPSRQVTAALASNASAVTTSATARRCHPSAGTRVSEVRGAGAVPPPLHTFVNL